MEALSLSSFFAGEGAGSEDTGSTTPGFSREKRKYEKGLMRRRYIPGGLPGDTSPVNISLVLPGGGLSSGHGGILTEKRTDI
jgi:hypothetical protein